MAGTPAPVAREELERLVHEYAHVRAEHRHARLGSAARRHLRSRLREIDTRFERVLAVLALEAGDRRAWRDHLHHQAPAPPTPPPEAPLVLEQGAADHWPARAGSFPLTVSVQGRIPRRARDDLERTLDRLARLTRRDPLHVHASLARSHDPALDRPVTAKATMALPGRTIHAHASAATAAAAVDLLEARLRRELRDLSDREDGARRRQSPEA